MGLTEYALSQSLYLALNHVNKSGLIPKTAAEFDKLCDERLGLKGSEKLQCQIVEQVLLPLARELMKEDQFAYEYALRKECELVGRKPDFEHKSKSVKRQNFQPNNKVS